KGGQVAKLVKVIAAGIHGMDAVGDLATGVDHRRIGLGVEFQSGKVLRHHQQGGPPGDLAVAQVQGGPNDVPSELGGGAGGAGAGAIRVDVEVAEGGQVAQLDEGLAVGIQALDGIGQTPT